MSGKKKKDTIKEAKFNKTDAKNPARPDVETALCGAAR
jgi:hypothetical protein